MEANDIIDPVGVQAGAVRVLAGGATGLAQAGGVDREGGGARGFGPDQCLVLGRADRAPRDVEAGA
jgi:hypothetical protein